MATVENELGIAADLPAYDVQVVFQGASGLPEDRFVNLWHFGAASAGLEETDRDNIQFELGTFYTAVQDYLSTVALGAANLQVTANIYRADDESPRQPLPETLGINLAAAPARGLPNEMALCVSFFARRNIPRHRGRVFIGPLSDTAMEAAVAGDGDRGPSAAAVTAFATAAAGLLVPTGNVFWCAKSSTTGAIPGVPDPTPTYREVTAGWVDNAFDVQRRRGTAASSRTVF